MVEEGLENREVAKVLVAEGDFDFANFLWNVFGIAKKFHDRGGDLPINGFNLRLRAEVEQTEVEHRLGALANFLGVVQIFEAVLWREIPVYF